MVQCTEECGMFERWQDFVGLLSIVRGYDKLEDIVLLGTRGFFVDKAVEQIVSYYVDEAFRVLDFQKIDYQDEGLDKFQQACSTMPSLSNKRVVLVENIDKKAAKQITEEFPKDSDHLKLVLTTKQDVKEIKLPKGSHRFNFKPLKKNDLMKFIRTYLNSYDKKVELKGRDYNNIEMIIDLSGYLDEYRQYNIYNLTNDLQKVIAYDEGSGISEEGIQAAMSDSLEMAIWDMLDEVAAGKKAEALEHLSGLLQGGDPPERLMAQIVGKMEQVYIVKEMTDVGWTLSQIEKVIKIPNYPLKKAYRIRGFHRLDTLKEVIMKAYQTDIDVKTGKLDRQAALELLVLSF